MIWKAEIKRWDEDEAEVRVDVDFLRDGTVVHSEALTEQAGTPETKILEEIGRRGKAAKKRLTSGADAENRNVGRTFNLSDL